MYGRWYILGEDGKTPIVSSGIEKCRAQRGEQDDLGPWRVDQTVVGESRVSTVFLSLDHQIGDGPPLLFETMVFGGPLDEEQDRYSTWDEAVAGHAAMCARVRASQARQHTAEGVQGDE